MFKGAAAGREACDISEARRRVGCVWRPFQKQQPVQKWARFPEREKAEASGERKEVEEVQDYGRLLRQHGVTRALATGPTLKKRENDGLLLRSLASRWRRQQGERVKLGSRADKLSYMCLKRPQTFV